MKIIEKKCPNCGANLKFKAGERNAVCESCRREFIIEYGAEDIVDDIKEAAEKIKADSVNLVPAAKVFGAVVAVHSVIIMLVSAVIIIAVIFGIVNAVNSFNKINDDIRNQKDELKSQQEDPFSSQEEYERALKELQERQKSIIDGQNTTE